MDRLLGKSIYIPNEDLLGSIPNGITFFEGISTECTSKMENPTLIKGQSFHRNTEIFFKSIAAETNLKAEVAKVFSLGFTLDATTKSVSGNKRSVSGTSLNIARKDFDLQFASTCLYDTNLQDRVLEDFASLPIEISKPWFKDSWREYDIFLHTHGSHVITAVTYGASIDQYAFGEESSSYTEKQFTIKACAALPGEAIGAAGLSLSACAGLSKNDMKDITNTKMTTSITIRGGSLETRNRLLSDKSADVIFKFLSEGDTNPAPIRYKLTPIWQVLNSQKQVKQSNLNRAVQAVNLQYYFDGFLNFDCPYIPADDRGPFLQLFNYAEHSTPERPVFQCTIAPEGCHSDKDCHRRMGWGCKCYGKSCIRHETVPQNSESAKLTAVRYYKKDWDGDKTCGRKTTGGSCICKNERFSRKVIFD
ncbi:Hypothetical predicted protein [Paramuricea clavata]|uniref:Uncharacterized protein n=1 Tax=Paramuricea clavata TaxID=317549 RepID=A0A6S7JCF4_PARCT|nr:Hypothetical predicted protein [Paramuricea clavata]